MALLHIVDASGRQWQCHLLPEVLCTIGRAPDNTVVLNDPRASRYHAHVKFQNGNYIIIDGRVDGGRSANHVFVGGEQLYEHELRDGDRVTIGASQLRFERAEEARPDTDVRYDDKPLGHTQLLVSANDVIRAALASRTSGTQKAAAAAMAQQDQLAELESLRGKAKILALLYEMSKTLGSVFTLDLIFDKACEVIFDATPADRVVALLKDESAAGDGDDNLRVVAMRVRDEKKAAQGRQQSIGRTITRKVMRERQALLSQDAAADTEFAGVHSIVSQGVHSTICAPLAAESRVHGALYADRLDAFTSFTRDDLELVSAVAAQTAIAVENARAHERLAREEVARANYSRFMPEYVVQQILENPDSFKLGGVNQTITVLFADIRGFTRLSEKAQPEKVVQLLNHYFTAMSDIIFAHGGTLDKYLGDGLMALFGAPAATPQDACNAVAAAVSMQRQMNEINEELRSEGLSEISIGIGLHTGEATVGYIGSERRSEYTAIGDTVNLASRLESNAQPGQILLSEAAAIASAGVNCTFSPRPPITVKNRVQPVPIFEVDWKQEKAMMNAEVMNAER
ncbi:MAG TPA: adenylate/guanylate cyclase domain-containing protein [Pyrinomonadaceae bacterium]|nr:adenylate/guanylate cyclase domain-containing protein [Pyrinomonadaceae bacterium]